MSMIQTIVTSLFHGHSVKTDPMPDFNLERYLGEWHEIARLENWFERGLSRVLARYDRREDGSISVVNSGYDVRTGERKEARARAVAGDAPNHLKVYFVPLVYGRYEVAFLDENYTRAVVSGGSLNYLWLLARSPQLKDDELQPMLHCAEKLGYTQKLFNRRPSMRDSFFGNDDFFGDFFSPMPSLLGRMNRMLESPFDDFFDAMPAIGVAPVQEVKEEKKDDLMSHEEQSRFSYLRQLNALKLEQKKAIHEENFERAAQLRDEIHKLEEAHKEAKESHKDGKESA